MRRCSGHPETHVRLPRWSGCQPAARVIPVVLLCCAIGGEIRAQQPADGGGEASPMSVSWKQLSPDAGRNNDPFAALTEDQLLDVALVVRVRSLVSQEKLPEDGADAVEAHEITKRLLEQDVDIDWLLAQRDAVRRMRKARSQAVAKSVAAGLDSQQILLAGYVIPLKRTKAGSTEFFLVPSVAACSHASPPPENQLVLVRSAKNIELSDRLTAARVVGALSARRQTRMLPGVDGPRRFTAGYLCETAVVETSLVTAAVQEAATRTQKED